ncbi:MAG TPA: adenylate/guanylate cyclase domain-containing protein [Alphaproteobacteria bacterium]|nr:adenylate/guanylate cyclase domain-containing protein [Alphaproteobacteria bacterium]
MVSGAAITRSSGAQPASPPTRPEIIVRRLRSATGAILFAYILTHYINHSLGLISLRAQEAGAAWFLAFWTNPVGTVVLYGAFLIHPGLALWRLYQRRSLRMPTWEMAQLLLGLAIPPLIIEHILATRLAYDLFGTQDSYAYVELVLWKLAPFEGVRQSLVLLVAWIHGCIGLHFWFRIKSWYQQRTAYFYAAALLIPVLAWLGFTEAGREVDVATMDPHRLAGALQSFHLPDAAGARLLAELESGFIYGVAALLALVLLARFGRTQVEKRRGLVRVTYPGNRIVESLPGATLLEISRAAGIPHASVCGGRGRCSTCRVRVNRGLEHQPHASPEELRVLSRVAAPPNVRLACQLHPVGDIDVTPLLPPQTGARDALARPGHLSGDERIIAILFADLRAFTKFAERRLPYDVVFVLNRYFTIMGHAVESAGGRVDKFIGDGVMALFGIETGPERGCRAALAAARGMAEQLAELNRHLAHELKEPLRIGIGIHVGPAIVGEMGYAHVTSLTAVGDAVNTASRLEAMTKEYQAQLVLSEEVARYAALDATLYPRHQIMVRGREEPLAIHVIANALDLPKTLHAGG